MIYSEMEYGTEELCEILALGDYRGHKYAVLSYGFHPCGYVAVPKDMAVDEKDIVCHGGVTYIGNKLNGVFLGDYYRWIGWDYSHYGDYSGLLWLKGGKKWTTKEIVEECENVIDQIVGENVS